MRLTIKSIWIVAALCTTTAAAFLLFFSWTHTSHADTEIKWGVDYSESQAVYLGLDPQKTYDAIINDLGAKNIKIHINWDSIEKKKGTFDFATLDREVQEAQDHNVQLILVIGMKTGRWPECHQPAWFDQVSEQDRQAELLKYISAVVERYKTSKAVEYWQVENEPFIKFGTCPAWYYKDGTALLQTEVDAVKSVDSTRQVIISDSGELSMWNKAAKVGDIVGITTYRSSWNPTQKTFGINPYAFLAPEFYTAKAALIQKEYGKPVISVELQAEPWPSKPLMEATLSEQAKSMNPQLFDENIAFAKQTGLSAFYFWGVEWWYYMKTKQNSPEIWDKATVLFAQ